MQQITIDNNAHFFEQSDATPERSCDCKKGRWDMSQEVQYPDCEASYTVTANLVARKKRPHRKVDGPFYPREAIPLPEDSYIECDGTHLQMVGGLMRSSFLAGTSTAIIFIGLVFLFLSVIYPFYSDGMKGVISMPIITHILAGLFISVGTYIYIQSRRTPFNDFIIFNREAGTVMFPPLKGRKPLVVPFEQVECYGTMHYHSRGGKHYLTYLSAKKKPRGEKDRVCPIHFSEAYGRTPTEREWKLVCTFMDKEQPIPKVFDRWINEFKRTGLNVCRKIVDQAAYDKALAEEEAEEAKAAHAADYY